MSGNRTIIVSENPRFPEVVHAVIPRGIATVSISRSEIDAALCDHKAFAAIIDSRAIDDDHWVSGGAVHRALQEWRIVAAVVHDPFMRVGGMTLSETSGRRIRPVRSIDQIWSTLRREAAEAGLSRLLNNLTLSRRNSHRLVRAVEMAMHAVPPCSTHARLADSIGCSVPTLASDWADYLRGRSDTSIHSLLTWISLLRWLAGDGVESGSRGDGDLSGLRSRLYRFCRREADCTLQEARGHSLPRVMEAFRMAIGE